MYLDALKNGKNFDIPKNFYLMKHFTLINVYFQLN